VKNIVLNDQEPEWVSNMKRGLATYLQMDLKSVVFNELQVLEVKEVWEIEIRELCFVFVEQVGFKA
jgi:hypothetical protein